MSMQGESYNSRSPTISQKKSVAGSGIKMYSYRPNSAIRTKPDHDTSHSPARNESKTTKKVSLTRYPTSSNSTRPFDSRSTMYRRKNDESTSSVNLSRSGNKWDKHLSIETSGTQDNYSGLNLKGYSVTNNSSQSMHKPSLSINSSSLTSKYSLYNLNTLTGSYSSHNKSLDASIGKASPLKKHASHKSYALNTSHTINSSNDKFFAVENTPKVDRNMHTNLNAGMIRAPSREEEEMMHLPPFEPTKCSIKQNGVIKAYAVNTHQGLVRNYNEDRVAIILNIMKPPHLSASDEWPLCSFFGVYDGHGGTPCADFLRDNLHQYVIQDKNFPKNPVEALRRGFEEAEKTFKELAQQNSKVEVDKSGSCAIVALIVEDMCYIANVGDSRAVASLEQGRKVSALSRDHKPNDRDEQKRILGYGGKIYQSQINQPPGYPGPKVIYGPHRVFPGRLSVSRTFGDIEAKLTRFGGNPNVVIAEPEIKAYRVTKDWDYLVLGCDGIFDKLNNIDVANCAWDSLAIKESDVHKQSAVAVERIMKESLIKKSLDNVTVVMVSFSGFERANANFEPPQEVLKPELEEKLHHPQKPLTNSFSLSPSDKMQGSYYTPSSSIKSYLSHHNDRQVYSATGKRYDSVGHEYNTSSPLLKQKMSFWRMNE